MTGPLYHIDPRDVQGAKDELLVQVAFRRTMRMIAPSVMLVAVPNAGRRTAWEARQRGKEGLVPGFPDMLAMHEGRTLALEFKSGTGTLSDAQKDCLNKLTRLDFAVGVFRGSASAVEWVRGHFPTAFVDREAA